jgi:hypothetical protein
VPDKESQSIHSTQQLSEQALRAGFDRLSKDPAVNKKGMERNGVPYEWVDVKKGEHVIKTLSDTDPKVLAEFKRLLDMGAKADRVVKSKPKKGK